MANVSIKKCYLVCHIRQTLLLHGILDSRHRISLTEAFTPGLGHSTRFPNLTLFSFAGRSHPLYHMITRLVISLLLICKLCALKR